MRRSDLYVPLPSQSKKAWRPMLVHVVGISTMFAIPVPRNAKSPIVVRPTGRETAITSHICQKEEKI